MASPDSKAIPAPKGLRVPKDPWGLRDPLVNPDSRVIPVFKGRWALTAHKDRKDRKVYRDPQDSEAKQDNREP